jgi:hypothetical protein
MRHSSRLLRLTRRGAWIGSREDPSLALPARGGRSAGWYGDAAPSPRDGSRLRRCCDPTNRAALDPLAAPWRWPAHATRATRDVVTDCHVNDYGRSPRSPMRRGCDAVELNATRTHVKRLFNAARRHDSLLTLDRTDRNPTREFRCCAVTIGPQGGGHTIRAPGCAARPWVLLWIPIGDQLPGVAASRRSLSQFSGPRVSPLPAGH